MQTYLTSTMITFIHYLCYIGTLAVLLLLIHRFFHFPKEVFRKLLHIAAFTSSIYLVLFGEGWLQDSLTLVLFAIVVYPLLSFAEKWSGYRNLFVEKKRGEIKTSLWKLFITQAVLLAFSCGFLKKPYMLIAATSSWGLGDIAAAWIGRPFGRHKANVWFADRNKSWEGTSAMALVSFISCFSAMYIFTDKPFFTLFATSFITSIVSALSELASKDGNDTVITPVSNTLALWLCSLFL